MSHLAGAYPGPLNMKRLEVFLLPSGWDVSHHKTFIYRELSKAWVS